MREGDTVKAGQVVARIDSTEYGARVKQAQEQADSAKAQIDIAQRQWDNNKALMDQGFISKTALDTSLNNLNAAQANHKAALAAVEMARKTLDDTVLRAPISGVVAQRLAQPGERVGYRWPRDRDRGPEPPGARGHAQRRRLRERARGPGGRAADRRQRQAACCAKVVRDQPQRAGRQPQRAGLPGHRRGSSGLRQGLFAQGTLGVGAAVGAWPFRCRQCAPTSPRPTCRWSRTTRSRTRASSPAQRGEAGKEVDGRGQGPRRPAPWSSGATSARCAKARR